MSHHYSGPDFGFPHGDARLDLTDLYAFPKPGDAGKSILIVSPGYETGWRLRVICRTPLHLAAYNNRSVEIWHPYLRLRAVSRSAALVL